VMKKLIPRNTTIPVRRSDIFSTAENNQTVVEIHVIQGERELGRDNKSLGRFKLTGVPPAPRGIPQIQVAFDIDANGMLLVTALDKTTGREQSITVQGASTLSQQEVNQMIRDAEQFAQADKLQREKVEKRNRAEALAYQAERQLREVALDRGMQFAQRSRQRIETLIRELRDSLERNDERGVDQVGSDLQDALYDLSREVSAFAMDDDDDDFFESVKRTFSGDGNKRRSDDNSYYQNAKPYRRSTVDPIPDRPYDRVGDRRTSSNRPTRPYQNQSDDWDDDDDWL
jgi:molecular chaperone DnaK